MGQTETVVRNRTTAGDDGGGKTRDILVAARELFSQFGYHKTSVREIAVRANVAVATVYAHFPQGKGGVLEAALTDRLQCLVVHILDSPAADLIDQFFDQVWRLNDERVRDPLLRRLQSERGTIPEPGLLR